MTRQPREAPCQRRADEEAPEALPENQVPQRGEVRPPRPPPPKVWVEAEEEAKIQAEIEEEAKIQAEIEAQPKAAEEEEARLKAEDEVEMTYCVALFAYASEEPGDLQFEADELIQV